MPKIVNTALKAKAKAKAWTFKAKAKATGPEAKAIKFGLEAPRGQGLASRTKSLPKGPNYEGFGSILRPRALWYEPRFNKSRHHRQQQSIFSKIIFTRF